MAKLGTCACRGYISGEDHGHGRKVRRTGSSAHAFFPGPKMVVSAGRGPGGSWGRGGGVWVRRKVGAILGRMHVTEQEGPTDGTRFSAWSRCSFCRSLIHRAPSPAPFRPPPVSLSACYTAPTSRERRSGGCGNQQQQGSLSLARAWYFVGPGVAPLSTQRRPPTDGVQMVFLRVLYPTFARLGYL